ncbi:MAG: aquaporin [Dehalococcoidia bacterium]|nr:aquaporin [Dehalococcoidia bacterium]
MAHDAPRRFAAELLGTFLLVFAGPGAIVINEASGGQIMHLGVGLSFGLAVMTAIVAFGPISGAHINPAVSLAFALSRRLAWSQLPVYLAGQIVGALAAAALLLALFGHVADLGSTVPSGRAAQALAIEVTITFFLVSVVLAATSNAGASLGSVALAVGGYVGLAATFAGPITGASMNPARSFGPAAISGVWDDHWVYWLGPTAGAVLGAAVHTALQTGAVDANSNEETSDEQDTRSLPLYR